MSKAKENLARHIIKLKKSIDNKLFDLLIDLDDENQQEYQFKDINYLLKFIIMKKILYNKRCNELTRITDKTLQQEITLSKTKDNLIYVSNILVKNRNEPPKGINSYILCNNNYDKNSIIKQYSLDMKPLIEYVDNNQLKQKNKLELYDDHKFFKNLRRCSNIEMSFNLDSYSVFDNNNIININKHNVNKINNNDNNIINNINNDNDVEHEDDSIIDFNYNDVPAPGLPLAKINDINNHAFNNINNFDKKYINEREEIKLYNNINVEDMSEKEQLKLAIELSKKQYLNEMIESAPKAEIDPLTGSITLTHKQRDRIRYYNNKK